MECESRPPAGPRGAVGARAEAAAGRYLVSLGWQILGRNLRIGGDEIDLVALEPGVPPELVIVEVRSSSGPRFGSPLESVDARKVARLYRAARSLARSGHSALPGTDQPSSHWRVDLVALTRRPGGPWRIAGHLRGLEPP